MKIGFPVAESMVDESDQLSIVGADGTPIPVDFDVLSRWPDKSVRWVLSTFTAPNEKSSETELSLAIKADDREPADALALTIDEQPTHLEISHGNCALRISTNEQSLFPEVTRNGVEILSTASTMNCLDSDGRPFELVNRCFKIIKKHRLSCEFSVESTLKNAAGQNIHLNLRYKYLTQGILDLDIEIHNPARAQHSRGLWDLGDPKSVLFKSLNLNLVSTAHDTCEIQCEIAREWTTMPADSNALLFQASSGGERWDSVNHCDSQGKVQNRFKGYQLSINDKEVLKGLHAEPTVRILHQQQTSYTLTMPEFWQNFPASIEHTPEALSLGIFPQAHGTPYELQGGEKKTKKIVLSFADDDLEWTHRLATVRMNSDDVIGTNTLRYARNHSNQTAYDKLLHHTLCEKNGIKAKREIIDEYGWRNYGEIYADHEALYHEGEEPFISHYNNQYDPIYGFARQYLLTGDSRWFNLMHDLARHVLDIDIYHTIEDRAEYNNGLFWHTDHYLKAHTASHRTYSQHHYAKDWEGPMGGGPGSEHCYTSGLALYYSLTGDQRAKRAVIKLQQWITFFYEGNGSLLNFFFLLVKRDSKNLLNILRGKNTYRYLYPFDRGVGNYLRALLDCYELDCEKTYIDRVEKIISDTFGPNDDIEERSLENSEENWYYTVFLQEVIRYLDVKRHRNEFDDNFIYAREALLHYASWMLKNETPYLSDPDKLKYANHTWVAQEARKTCIFYAAYRYSIDDREPFRSRAIYFHDYIVEQLQNEPTAAFARIQILLMQCHGPHQLIDTPTDPYPMPPLQNCPPVSAHYSASSFAGCLGRRFYSAVSTFRPGKEINWIKARVA